jgi:alpha-tubulin suppressor-like RCC1 family protein
MSPCFPACQPANRFARLVHHVCLWLVVVVSAGVIHPVRAGFESRLLGLSGLPAGISPQFSSDQMTYTASVDLPFLPLTPLALDPEAVVEVRVNGGAFMRVAAGAPLSAADNYLAALRADGRIVQWGTNNFDGTVIPPSNLTDVVSVASGYAFNLALRKSGTVRAWGAPGVSFLGSIAAQTGVAAIFATTYHTHIVKSDGSLMTWGGIPLPAGGVSRVVSVCQNTSVTVAAKSDGSVVAWDRSGFAPSMVPAGLSDVTMVACSEFNVAALRSDGTVRVWSLQPGGYNAVIPPVGLKDIVSICGNGSCFLALGRDGKVTAIGTGPGTRVPAGLEKVTAIAAPGYCAALKSDGTLVTWGRVPTDNLPPPQGSQFATSPATLPVNLGMGPNVVEVRVTPPPGGPSRTYTIQVNRTANPALRWLAPDRGELTPSFSPSVTSYSMSLPFASDGIRFLPITHATGSTVQWNGSPIAADVQTALLSLVPGANDFVFRTLTEDGTASREYRVRINREPPATSRTLRFLADDRGPLTPAFSPGHLTYSHAVPVRQPTLRVWPKVGAVSAKVEVRVNGGPYTRVSSGNASAVAAVIQEDGMPIWWDPTELTRTVTAGDPVVPCGGISTSEGGVFAIRTDGTVLSRNPSGGKYSAGLSGVVELTEVHPVNGNPQITVALMGSGTVQAWETATDRPVSVFPGETQIVTVAGGRYLTAVRRDGTLAIWSPPVDPYPLMPLNPAPTNLVSCSAATPASVLRSDGTRIAWGPGSFEPVYTIGGVAGVVPGHGFDNFHIRQDGRLGVLQGNLPQLEFSVNLRDVLFARSHYWLNQAVRSDGEVILWAYANGNLDGTGVPAGLKARAHPESVVVPLQLGDNLVEVRVTAEDGTHSAYTISVPRIANLDLATLSLNGGEFPINFGAGATTFTLDVPSGRESLTFQASLQDATETMMLNGVPLLPGVSSPVALVPGLNNITLVVTDQNQSSSRTYTFAVTRLPVRADLASMATSAGAMTPGFSPDILQYELTTTRPELVVWPTVNGVELEARTGQGAAWRKLSRGNQVVRSPFVWVTPAGTVSGLASGGALTAPAGLSDVISIAAGDAHITALRGEGTVVSWGVGAGAQAPAGLVGIRAIAAAGQYTLALRTDGTVTGWGDNSHGQLTFPAGLNGVIAFSAQGGPAPWVLALRRDGTVLAWGAGRPGSLAVPPGLKGVVAISGMDSAPTGITPSYPRAAALLGTGRVLFWNVLTGVLEPELSQLHDIVSVSGNFALRRDGSLVELTQGLLVTSVRAAALEGGMAIKGDGSLWSVSGSFDAQQVAGAVVEVRPSWLATDLLAGSSNSIELRASDGGVQKVTRLEVTRKPRTDLRSLAVDGPLLMPAFDRSVRSYALGTHADSSLRIRPAPANANSVVEVRSNGGAWKRVASAEVIVGRDAGVAYGQPIVVRDDGKIGSWHPNFSEAVDSAGLFSRRAISAAHGGEVAMVLLDDGNVFARNAISTLLPEMTAPSDVRDLVAIAVGERHAVSLGEDGRIRVWGASEDGKLVIPAGLPVATQVRAGRNHSLALLADGTVAAWGKNDAGQCSVPSGLSEVVAIAAGHTHSMALRRNGTVVVWGVLGDGSTAAPAGLRNVVFIAADEKACVAVTADGTGTRWGDAGNAYGAGATPWQWTGVTSLTTGYSPVLASMSSNSVRNWQGDSYFVPLGDAGPEALKPAVVSLPLQSGPNTVEVRVTDPRGGDSSVTTLTVTRTANPELASLKPEGLSLTPAFDPEVSAYAAEVAAGADSLTLRFAPRESDATVRIDGAPVTDGNAVVPIPRGPATSIIVTVTSADGTATKAYQLNIARAAASSVAGLGLLTTAIGSLSPGFDPEVRLYQQEYRFAQAAVRAVPLGTASRMEVSLNGGPWQDLHHGQRLAQTQIGSLMMGTGGVPVSWTHGVAAYAPVPDGLSEAASIAGYNKHMLALRPDGTVVAWGDNSRGQVTVPAGLKDVIAVAAGSFHSMALRENGQVVVWGSGEAGLRDVPAGLNDVTAIAAGQRHCLALRRNGTVVTWGDTSLGLAVPAGLSGITAIAAVNQFSSALRPDGRVISWGQAAPSWPSLNAPALLDPWGVGVVGATGLVTATSPPGGSSATIPSDLGDVVSLLGNRSVGMAVKPDGTVRTWASYATAPPAGTRGDTRPLFLPFPLKHGVNTAEVRVTAEDGVTQSVYQVNINRPPNTDLTVLRLSNATFTPAYQPGVTQYAASVPSSQTSTELTASASDSTSVVSVNGVVSPTGRTVIPLVVGVNTVNIDVAASDGVTMQRHTLVITRQPSLASLNLHGLGTSGGGVMNMFAPGIYEYTATAPVGEFQFWPRPANAGAGLSFRHNGGVWRSLNGTGRPPAAGSSSFVIALRTNGTPVAWSSTLNTLQTTAAGLSNIVAVAAGSNHAMALSSSGRVVVWGSTDATLQPSASLAEMTAIASGRNHCLALGLTGTVAAWGSNSNQQTSVPAALPPIMAIAGGGTHSLALSRDGRVFSWGAMAQSTVPAGLPPVVALAAGDDFSVALKNDGTVVAWGVNTNGQRTPPAGLANVVQVACGGRHVLALRSNGTVVAWGDNGAGQSTVPAGLTDVVAVNAGGSFSLAVKRDGRLVVWGTSSAGQRNIPADLIMPSAASVAMVPPLPGAGTTEFRITSADGLDSRTYSVVSNRTLQSAYSVWSAGVFTAGANAGATQAAGDFDQDGLANVLEYLTGSNPVRPSASPLTVSIDDGMLSVRWPRLAGWPNGLETLEGAASLSGPWTTVPLDTLSRTPGEGGAPDTMTLRRPMSDGTYFLRLRMPLP